MDSELNFSGLCTLGLQKPQSGVLWLIVKNPNWVWHDRVRLGSLEEGTGGWSGSI